MIVEHWHAQVIILSALVVAILFTSPLWIGLYDVVSRLARGES